MTLGLVAALPAEIGCITNLPVLLDTPFRINKHLIAIVCGTGAKNAARATQGLLYQNIRGLISWGTAGALSSELKSGDLILPDIVQATDNRLYKPDSTWLEHIRLALKTTHIRIHSGKLAETNVILESGTEKSGLRVRTGDAIAADMETAAIMKIAQDSRIPGIAIRSIVDQLDDQLPGEILKHTDQYGTPRITNILAEIISEPRLLKHLVRLFIAMRKATRTLRFVATRTNETLMYMH